VAVFHPIVLPAARLAAIQITQFAHRRWNRFHQCRTVSWQMSIPRSKSRSSTFRRLSGKQTYIMITRRITSGDELKQRNGLGGLYLDLRDILRS
jgi:hypothetical protein